LVIGKGNHLVTLHLLKAASKSSRLDAAPLRKRTAQRNESILEVKPGDVVLGITFAWMLDQFLDIKPGQSGNPERKKEVNSSRKPAAKKRTTAKSKAVPSKKRQATPKPEDRKHPARKK
jgi:hypothetical protein